MADVLKVTYIGPHWEWEDALRQARRGNPVPLAELVEREAIPPAMRRRVASLLRSLWRNPRNERLSRETVDNIRALFAYGQRNMGLTVDETIDKLTQITATTVSGHPVKLTVGRVTDVVYQRGAYADPLQPPK